VNSFPHYSHLLRPSPLCFLKCVIISFLHFDFLKQDSKKQTKNIPSFEVYLSKNCCSAGSIGYYWYISPLLTGLFGFWCSSLCFSWDFFEFDNLPHISQLIWFLPWCDLWCIYTLYIDENVLLHWSYVHLILSSIFSLCFCKNSRSKGSTSTWGLLTFLIGFSPYLHNYWCLQRSLWVLNYF
jgi:hypothetical protein